MDPDVPARAPLLARDRSDVEAARATDSSRSRATPSGRVDAGETRRWIARALGVVAVGACAFVGARARPRTPRETNWMGAKDVNASTAAATGAAGDARATGDGYPIYLHIPKTGGSTIEGSLGRVGIGVGMCFDKVYDRPMPYETHPRMSGWEAWHCVPRDYVRNSWTIVRDPYERAQSEFLYETAMYEEQKFYDLRTGYAAENCEAFQDFVRTKISAPSKSVLLQCYAEGDYDMAHQKQCDEKLPDAGVTAESHWYPQALMASRAETVHKMELCFGENPDVCPKVSSRGGGTHANIVKYMRDRYNPEVTLVHENQWTSHARKPDLRPCWERMDDDVLTSFNDVYGSDFKLYDYGKIQSLKTAPNIPSKVLFRRVRKKWGDGWKLADIELKMKSRNADASLRGETPITCDPKLGDRASIGARENKRNVHSRRRSDS